MLLQKSQPVNYKMNPLFKFPFYLKLAIGLLSLIILLTIIYIGQKIFIPILLSLLFAILLLPVVDFLNKKMKFPNVIAVIVSVFLFIFLISGIIFFVSKKIGDITDDWDEIKNNFSIHYYQIQQWIVKSLHISLFDQNQYIQEATKKSVNEKTLLAGNILNSFSVILLNFFLIPVYTFLFLLYRNLLIRFLSKLFAEEHQYKLQNILLQIKVSVQSFLTGLLIELLIVATLTSIGLMIIGVPYAVLLGVITGILNLIPYIGILIAGLLSIIVSLTGSANFSIIIGVIVVNIIVQLIDNNVLVPMIVSPKVKINALVSIIGIIIGSALAGVGGMFLAIPVIAILKVIFDRVEPLEPWGFLMGDGLPNSNQWKKIKFPSFDVGNFKNSSSGKKDENNSMNDKT